MSTNLKMIFEFIPSVDDINEYQGNDSYGCGINEVKDEVVLIIEQLEQEFLKSTSEERKTIPTLKKPKNTVNYMPELIINIDVIISSGAIATVVYKLISKWIDYKNGRKFKVKLPDGLEVETTQSNEKEFKLLVDYFYQKYNSKELTLATEEELRKFGFNNTKTGTEEDLKALQLAYESKRDTLSKQKNT